EVHSKAAVLERDSVRVKKAVREVAVLDAFDRFPADVRHEFSEVETETVAYRRQVTEGGVLECFVEITDTVGAGCLDRIHDRVLNVACSDIDFKADPATFRNL